MIILQINSEGEVYVQNVGWVYCVFKSLNCNTNSGLCSAGEDFNKRFSMRLFLWDRTGSITMWIRTEMRLDKQWMALTPFHHHLLLLLPAPRSARPARRSPSKPTSPLKSCARNALLLAIAKLNTRKSRTSVSARS